MAAAKNVTTSRSHTTVIGAEKPLDDVTVYYYTHNDQLELTADARSGNTIFRWETRITKRGAKELAKQLVHKLNLTPEDLGLAPQE